jgi:branched-chain amino acid transport system ATP-binding protein
MLRVRNLEAGYGKLRVLKRISMHVDPGEIVTIIGANGAGKTTLLHTITGLVKISSGEVLFKGNNLQRVSSAKIVFAGCSLVPEGRQVFSTMTVQENLVLGGYVLTKRDKKDIIHEMAEGEKKTAGRDPLGRGAADARHGQGPDGQAVPHHDG